MTQIQLATHMDATDQKDSEDSINNPNGKYGDPQSNDSPNNPYATNAPIVLDQEDN